MEALNHHRWGFDPRDISALFLTHAHIDHSGRIPKLVKDGFRGKIYTTRPTAELCKILLLDSAHIQEMEAEWQSRKNRRRGKPDVPPLYTVAQAEACFPLFEVVPRDEPIRVDPHLTVCFRNSGHILGSSLLEVTCEEGTSRAHKAVFSGDLGHRRQLIIQDPYVVRHADTLFIESTYGNRNHKSFEESKKELLEAIHYSYHYREKVIIPAFAVARTQELLYILGEFFRNGLIPSMPVYLDSPLAIAATEIFRHMREYYDEDALEILKNGHDPLDFPQLVLSRSAQDSMAINETPGPAIVIAGNGMCTAGRIKHHLKHNLWRQGCSVIIVGFQAAGTLGRRIVDGNKVLRVLGERIAVRAKVFTIGGFSAHAGQSDLLEWLGHFENPHMSVYAIHGEESACQSFASCISERFGYKVYVPSIGDRISLEEPEAAKREVDTVRWQENLLNIMTKVRELRRIMESSPQAVSPALLEQLERELLATEERLDEALRDASKTAPKKEKPLKALRHGD